MEIITYQDAIQKAKQKDQKLSLLLGNGFSIDFDSKIFSQEKLIQSAKNKKLFQNEKLLTEILVREKIENFEVLMQLIRDYCSLPEEIEEEKAKLFEIIIQALTYSHPHSSLAIEKIQSNQCAQFLSNFQSIYTLNYDLLLYWVIMIEKRHGKFQDGFCKNGFIWVPKKNTNVYYLHGALYIYETPNNEVAKYRFSIGKSLKKQIETSLKENKLPITVSGGTSQEKIEIINQCKYLMHCLESLENAEGILFIHGFNFNPNDEHIIDAIAHSQIEKLFISVYQLKSEENISNAIGKIQKTRNLQNKKPLEVTFYEAETAEIWRKTLNSVREEQSIAEEVW